ncbi:MAG: nucleotidyltransferase [Planctomycetes bacterium]|nr:nucleotidyltransferase [Planctomycetota bacterium]
MELPRDFSELLESFNDAGVEYLLVGGYALAHFGAPRFTGDMDLFVRPTAENARRVLAALDRFGFGGLGLAVDDFTDPDQVVQLGVPPVRVDLLTGLSGTTWELAYDGSETSDYDGVLVRVISKSAFIANKRATSRPRDLADLESIGED